MENYENNECQICLNKTISKNNLVSGCSIRELSETLFIDLGITNENFLICTKCEQKIQQAFTFKTLCLDGEHLLPNCCSKAIKSACSEEKNNEESHVNVSLCRLCKNALEGHMAISLKELLEIENINEIFQKHIPELDLLPYKNPFICEVCWNHLVDFQNLLMLIHQQSNRKETELNRRIKTDNIKHIAVNTLKKYPKIIKITQIKKRKVYIGKWGNFKTLHCFVKASGKRSQEIATKTSNDKTNPQEVKIKCDKCNFQSEDPRAYQKHLNFVHTKIYQCSWCSFATTTEMFLNTHLSNHVKITNQSKYQIYKCELCDFQTTALEDLKQHIDKHM